MANDNMQNSPYLQSSLMRFALLGLQEGIPSNLVRSENEEVLLLKTMEEARLLQYELNLQGYSTNLMYAFPMVDMPKYGIFWEPDCGHSFTMVDMAKTLEYKEVAPRKQTSMGVAA